LPCGDLPNEQVLAVDAPVEALAQHADLDFDHIEPTGVLWGVAELQTPQGLACGAGKAW
jgi:hypothetical protein